MTEDEMVGWHHQGEKTALGLSSPTGKSHSRSRTDEGTQNWAGNQVDLGT